MCCQCLLKQTRITTFQLSNGSHVCLKRIHPKSSLVTWLITLLLIICPSSYKARPDNLIGTNSSGAGIIPTQRSNASTNFPQMLWAGLSSAGTQASCPLLPTKTTLFPECRSHNIIKSTIGGRASCYQVP